MKEKIDKIDYYNLRKILVGIYECASAWDNDDGKMAEANEKTAEDILAEIIENAKNEGRKEILEKCKEIILEYKEEELPSGDYSDVHFAENEINRQLIDWIIADIEKLINPLK